MKKLMRVYKDLNTWKVYHWYWVEYILREEDYNNIMFIEWHNNDKVKLCLLKDWKVTIINTGKYQDIYIQLCND